MDLPQAAVVRALRNPQSTPQWPLEEWELVVRQARRANLLSHLAVVWEAKGLLQEIPEQPRRHLQNARMLAQRHADSVLWELSRIRKALEECGVPVVVLKGAAYVLARLPPGRGRLFNDVDIMVPRAALSRIENALAHHGWIGAHHDAYDQRYYRRWMHELPPLRHIRRQTALDVHHTILPPTAGLRLDADELFAAATPVPGTSGLQVLAPADLVLHSAAHLFFDGELDHGLRDLVDLDALLREFTLDPSFWDRLAARASALDLERPLHYALRYAGCVLGTPVPEPVLARLRVAAPGPRVQALMDALFLRALAPMHASCSDRHTGLARWLLYVRSHHLRMPWHLLVPHLLHKALKRNRPPERRKPALVR